MTAQATTPIKESILLSFMPIAEWIKQDYDYSVNYSPKPKTLSEKRHKEIGKLLLNAWSAEYALRIMPVVNDEQYLQSSLDWVFPQAYYSVLFSARAFLSVLNGERNGDEKTIRRRIGTLVQRGYYPAPLNAYAIGAQDNYRVCRSEADGVMYYPLIDTRNVLMAICRRDIQLNPKTAFRNNKGEVLQKFGREQYKQLAKQIGTTTFFDVMARLRISVNNRELERFSTAEINIREFHAALTNIVNYINLIHERHIVSAIGEDAFREIVRSLPSYLQEGFLAKRMDDILFKI